MNEVLTLPDALGHFGPYGGMFVPETLMSALHDLAVEYERAKKDPAFQDQLSILLRDFAGRPTPLYFAERLTNKLSGPQIYLKREDLLHTGAHKINNALGQILLAQRMVNVASLLKPARASTASRLPPSRRGSVANASST